MEDKPENPPAFPGRDYNTRPFTRGMELRDYFAGQALAGIVTREDFSINYESFGENSNTGIAKDAYALADAMLAERSKSNA